MSLVTMEMKKQFEQEGYVIFKDLFSDQEIDALRGRIDKHDEESQAALRLIGQSGISIANQINFNALLNQKDAQIQAFTANRTMVDITTALIGPDMKLYWDQSVYKSPEANRDFPWHQDNGYAPIEPAAYVTCWLALEDATIENGCVWILPRTHLQGEVEHKPTEVGLQCYFGQDPGIPVELKKGSMVAFHSLLFHRSTPNVSDTIRKGFIMQYSVDGAIDPRVGTPYDNGPTIAIGGKAVHPSAVQAEA